MVCSDPSVGTVCSAIYIFFLNFHVSYNSLTKCVVSSTDILPYNLKTGYISILLIYYDNEMFLLLNDISHFAVFTN